MEIIYLYHCNVCDRPIRDKHHRRKHIQAYPHKKRIVRDFPQYLVNDPSSPARIDLKKKFDMIVERRTTRQRVDGAREDDTEGEDDDGEQHEVLDDEFTLEFLLDVDNHYDILDTPAVLPRLIQMLIDRGSREGVDFDRSMDFLGFMKKFKAGELSDDDKMVFVYQMAQVLDDFYST